MSKAELLQEILADDSGDRVLIWGPSGTGKTHFGLTFPNVWVYDWDGGMKTALNPDLPDYVGKNSYHKEQGADAFPQFLRDWNDNLKNPEIKTFFIDSLTTMSDHLMRFILKVDGKPIDSIPRIQHWGGVISKISSLFYSATAESGKRNLVVAAHSQIIESAEEGKVKYVPLVAGKKLPDRIGLWFDEMYHSEVAGMRSQRKFEVATVGSPMYDAKSRYSSIANLKVNEPNDWRVIWGKIEVALNKMKGDATEK